MKEENPFKFGKVVRDDAFCNRAKEIKTLKNYIRDGQSVWLYSPRRYGKTSLVNKVFSELTETRTIYFDLYNIKDLDDFTKKYARLIAEELFDWKQNFKQINENINVFFKGLKPSISFDENGNPSFMLQRDKIVNKLEVETVLNLPHEIGKRSKTSICIAFDEFQEISRIDPFIINWMRSAFQHHTNISYVFLGSKQSLMQSIFSSYNSPFYEFGVKMNIEPIGRNELSIFIHDKFKRQGMSVKESMVDSILDISGGHPHFTQYFASEVYYLIKAGGDQDDPAFNQHWLSKIIDSQSNIFQGMYDQLTNIQRIVLQAVVLIKEGEELFSDLVRMKYGLPVSSSLSSTLNSLIKKDLIYKSGKRYKMVNPIFKHWLISIQ